MAVLCSLLLVGLQTSPANADVTQVRGRAFGYHADDISLFGGSQPDTGPTPDVQLAADASNSPQSASQPSGKVQYGPATIFSSDQIDVSSTGSLGASGSVSSTADIDNINKAQDPDSGSEIFTADNVNSTCTASETGVTGSTTVTNGTLRTHAQSTDHGEGEVQIPTNPPPNYAVEGHVHLDQNTTDYYVVVFNEQITNPDGSITVNAVHEYFGATLDNQGNIQNEPNSILQGDLYLGRVTCGVTATQTTTTTTTTQPGATTTTQPGATTTTTVPGSTTTTTTPGSTTTTTMGSTTTTTTTTTTVPSGGGGGGGGGGGAQPPSGGTPPPSGGSPPAQQPPSTGGSQPGGGAAGGNDQVTGSAYGYWTEVSLFGGPSSERGPEPHVQLSPDASNSPQEASVQEAEAVYGPAVIFKAGQMEVRTEGAVGADAHVRSSASVQGHPSRDERPGPLLYDAIESSCSVDDSGVEASVSFENGVVETRYDENTQEPVQTRDIPANPPPGFTIEGTIDHVGDRFRIVFNEQEETASGITVNAAHMYLLGPIAVGDMIVGQTRCIIGGAGGGPGSAAAGNVGGAADGAGNGAQLANTGSSVLPLLMVALGFVFSGAGLLARGSGGRRSAGSAARRVAGIAARVRARVGGRRRAVPEAGPEQ